MVNPFQPGQPGLAGAAPFTPPPCNPSKETAKETDRPAARPPLLPNGFSRLGGTWGPRRRENQNQNRSRSRSGGRCEDGSPQAPRPLPPGGFGTAPPLLRGGDRGPPPALPGGPGGSRQGGEGGGLQANLPQAPLHPSLQPAQQHAAGRGCKGGCGANPLDRAEAPGDGEVSPAHPPAGSLR